MSFNSLPTPLKVGVMVVSGAGLLAIAKIIAPSQAVFLIILVGLMVVGLLLLLLGLILVLVQVFGKRSVIHIELTSLQMLLMLDTLILIRISTLLVVLLYLMMRIAQLHGMETFQFQLRMLFEIR